MCDQASGGGAGAVSRIPSPVIDRTGLSVLPGTLRIISRETRASAGVGSRHRCVGNWSENGDTQPRLDAQPHGFLWR